MGPVKHNPLILWLYALALVVAALFTLYVGLWSVIELWPRVF